VLDSRLDRREGRQARGSWRVRNDAVIRPNCRRGRSKRHDSDQEARPQPRPADGSPRDHPARGEPAFRRPAVAPSVPRRSPRIGDDGIQGNWAGAPSLALQYVDPRLRERSSHC
jgi:hypothetical protein